MEHTNIPEVKECPVCERLLTNEHYTLSSISGDGLHYVCRECNSMETWYRVNQKKMKGRIEERMEYHKMLLRRYRRLHKGMKGREAARDELKYERTHNAS